MCRPGLLMWKKESLVFRQDLKIPLKKYFKIQTLVLQVNWADKVKTIYLYVSNNRIFNIFLDCLVLQQLVMMLAVTVHRVDLLLAQLPTLHHRRKLELSTMRHREECIITIPHLLLAYSTIFMLLHHIQHLCDQLTTSSRCLR